MTKASERALNYAREREWRNLDRIHQSDAEVVAELHRILDRTLDNCKAQAEAWYTRYAAANGITPAEARKRATEADIAALERKAKNYVARRKDTAYAFSEQANKQMAEYNFSMKMSREELLMRYIDLELSAGTDEENTLLGDHLTKLSEDELKRQAGLLGMRLPDHKELTDLARTIATSSFHGETFSYRLWQNQSSLRALLGDGIARSILLGKNPTTWMRSLEGHLRDAGNNAKYRLKRLAITEAGRVQIEAQKQSYDRAGYSQYIVVCEPTACPVCREHDGKVYNVKDLMQGKNAPMFHPFCKCSTAAHMDRKEVDDAIAELEKEEGKTVLTNPAVATAQTSTGAGQGSVLNFSSCKDFTELKKMLSTRFGITITEDVENLEYDLVRDTLNGFERLAGKYPDVAKRITEITTSDKGLMSCNGNSITFNPFYYDSRREVINSINKMTAIGWWPKNTSVASIGAHEVGHAINYDLLCKNPTYINQIQIVLDWNDQDTAKRIVSQACKEVKKTPYGKGKRNAELRRAQSGYGASLDAEAIAEAYADEYANGTSANPLSLKIIEIIDNLFTQYGGANVGP